jgi:hypothetical protein
MNHMPERVPASTTYLIGTVLLAGVAGALFSFLLARLIGISAGIAAAVTGISLAAIVGLLIRRHGRPNEEL